MTMRAIKTDVDLEIEEFLRMVALGNTEADDLAEYAADLLRKLGYKVHEIAHKQFSAMKKKGKRQ